MKKTKFISVFALTISLFATLSINAFADSNNVHSKTPVNADKTVLYWATKAGSGYDTGAAGIPIIVGDSIVSCTGTSIIKYDRYTGELLPQKGELVDTSNYNIIAPLYAEGMIFVGLKDGTVQAFDADTLESLWIYKDALKGQPNSPIVYHNGYIYTGFWNSETKAANFVCISVSDEDTQNTHESKSAKWTFSHKGGFYWAGAYVCDRFLLVGTDDGDYGYLSDTSSLLSLDPATGQVIDHIDSLNGDIRSSIAFDESTDRFYFTSKGGSFYSVAVSENGSFKTSVNGLQGYDLYEIYLSNGFETESEPAVCTSTPVICNGRAYIGICGSSMFTQYSGHNITVIDLASRKIAYKAQTKGFPQTSGLLSNAYTDTDGYNYVYFVDNLTPGQIRVLKDKPNVTAVVDPATEYYTDKGVTYSVENCAPVLFTPSGAQAQCGICTPVADEFGTLYFKNDSTYLLAVGSRIESIEITKLPDKTVYNEGEVFDPNGMQVVAHLANGLDRDVTDYISYYAQPLTTDSTDIAITYDHMLCDAFGNELETPETYVDITVADDSGNDNSQNIPGTVNVSDSSSSSDNGSSKPVSSDKTIGASDNSPNTGENTPIITLLIAILVVIVLIINKKKAE